MNRLYDVQYAAENGPLQDEDSVTEERILAILREYGAIAVQPVEVAA